MLIAIVGKNSSTSISPIIVVTAIQPNSFCTLSECCRAVWHTARGLHPNVSRPHSHREGRNLATPSCSGILSETLLVPSVAVSGSRNPNPSQNEPPVAASPGLGCAAAGPKLCLLARSHIGRASAETRLAQRIKERKNGRRGSSSPLHDLRKSRRINTYWTEEKRCSSKSRTVRSQSRLCIAFTPAACSMLCVASCM